MVYGLHEISIVPVTQATGHKRLWADVCERKWIGNYFECVTLPYLQAV